VTATPDTVGPHTPTHVLLAGGIFQPGDRVRHVKTDLQGVVLLYPEEARVFCSFTRCDGNRFQSYAFVANLVPL
jgi:hypothetical protein